MAGRNTQIKFEPETELVNQTKEPETELVAVITRPLDQNPAAIYLASLRPGGRDTMRRSLEVIAEIASNQRETAFNLEWAALRYQHTTAIRAILADRYKPATANKMLSALRRVLKEAWRLGQLGAEDYYKAIDLPAVRGQTLPKGRAVKNSELETLLELCQADKTPGGARDAAILAVLYSTGLRRAELVKLDLIDYNREEATLVVRGGKGGKDRRCFLGEGAVPALQDWLKTRGNLAGPLFCPITKSGSLRKEQNNHLKLKRLTTQAVLFILQKRVTEAGGEVASLSPHDLRRTFISDLLEAGNDLSTVQKMAGHANVTTTARYDRRGEEAQRKAARSLNVPYKRSESLP